MANATPLRENENRRGLSICFFSKEEFVPPPIMETLKHRYGVNTPYRMPKTPHGIILPDFVL